MPANQPDQTDMSQNRMDPDAPAIAEHREYKKSRHFWRLSFVELRGIEPRSDDRTLSLLRA